MAIQGAEGPKSQRRADYWALLFFLDFLLFLPTFLLAFFLPGAWALGVAVIVGVAAAAGEAVTAGIAEGDGAAVCAMALAARMVTNKVEMDLIMLSLWNKQ